MKNKVHADSSPFNKSLPWRPRPTMLLKNSPGLNLPLTERPFILYCRQILRQATALRWDPIGPACIVLLMTAGVVFIHSAQSYAGGTRWKIQIFWGLIGACLYVLTALVDYKVFLEKGHWIYWACVVLLLLLWTPLGKSRFGSLRWVGFGNFAIQPSEPAKVGVLIMIAGILARSKIHTVRHSLKTLMQVAIAFLGPILLIFLQPDLGSTLVFPPMVFALLYVSRLSRRFFGAVLGVALLMLAILAVDIRGYRNFLEAQHLTPEEARGLYEKRSLLPLHDYQRERVLSFAAPETVDPRGIGVSWNLRQSLIAVGSGGLWGKGIGQGTQPRLGYLPQTVACNDFIFSVLAEEIGFAGSMSILLLFALLAFNTMRIAGLARDRFGMLLCTGAGVIFVFHVFINMGMTIGLVPITGIPLPFLSYGGSFVLSCCVLQGLVQSVYRYRKDFS